MGWLVSIRPRSIRYWSRFSDKGWYWGRRLRMENKTQNYLLLELPPQDTCIDKTKSAECFTCDLHYNRILEWLDKRESVPPRSPAEVGCLFAVRLYAPGRFGCLHAGPCRAVCPVRTEKKRGSPVCHTTNALPHSQLACDSSATSCQATSANVSLCTDKYVQLAAFLDPGSGRRFAKVIRGKFCKASSALQPGFLGKDIVLLAHMSGIQNARDQGHISHVTEVSWSTSCQIR